MSANLFALLNCEFSMYARRLRDKYPDKKIRNSDVYESAILAFSRLSYIELVDTRKGLPTWVPNFLAARLRRVRHLPIWIPGHRYPDEPFEIFRIMQPEMIGGRIVWHHTPTTEAPGWWQSDLIRKH